MLPVCNWPVLVTATAVCVCIGVARTSTAAHGAPSSAGHPVPATQRRERSSSESHAMAPVRGALAAAKASDMAAPIARLPMARSPRSHAHPPAVPSHRSRLYMWWCWRAATAPRAAGRPRCCPSTACPTWSACCRPCRWAAPALLAALPAQPACYHSKSQLHERQEVDAANTVTQRAASTCQSRPASLRPQNPVTPPSHARSCALDCSTRSSKSCSGCAASRVPGAPALHPTPPTSPPAGRHIPAALTPRPLPLHPPRHPPGSLLSPSCHTLSSLPRRPPGCAARPAAGGRVGGAQRRRRRGGVEGALWAVRPATRQ
jgi:hypothetical protein